jgi:ketosteroid isomerase-like protein
MNQEADQREVIAFIKALNACWTKGNVEQLRSYIHADMVAITPMDRNILQGRNACLASWKKFTEMAKIFSWEEKDIQVRLFADTAIVTYYYDMLIEMGGNELALSGRDMFTLIREGGRWWAVADQFSPYPTS